MSNRPILHISILYSGNSKLKTKLKKQLSVYTERLLSSLWEPSVDICLDTFSSHEEKHVQQELIYDTVVSYRTKQRLTTTEELYTIIILLISLTRQRLYENNPNFKTEDLMIISITPSDADDQATNNYDIEWSLGK